MQIRLLRLPSRRRLRLRPRRQPHQAEQPRRPLSLVQFLRLSRRFVPRRRPRFVPRRRPSSTKRLRTNPELRSVREPRWPLV
jgi:hypothetical protein